MVPTRPWMPTSTSRRSRSMQDKAVRYPRGTSSGHHSLLWKVGQADGHGVSASHDPQAPAVAVDREARRRIVSRLGLNDLAQPSQGLRSRNCPRADRTVLNPYKAQHFQRYAGIQNYICFALLKSPGLQGQNTVTKQLARHPIAYPFSSERAKNMVSDE
jgi:hypothetical protein